MPFRIERNDITKVRADAIVNTANPRPIVGSGTDTAIYEAAGKEKLLAAREKIGNIAQGEVAVTDAFALKAKYILHTVGPVWIDGKSGEFDVLASCYRKSLVKAVELGCGSIAFPLLATGNYGFPKDAALRIAIREISGFLTEHELDVTLVVFDRASFAMSGRVFDDVAALLDDAAVEKKRLREYFGELPEERNGRQLTQTLRLREIERREEAANEANTTSALPAPHSSDTYASSAEAGIADDLSKLLGQKSETFVQCLFRMIDARGLKDADVYRRANIDRKLFSKIRCDPDYHPKKKTAVALAIALELSMEETVELLGKAEWALTSASKFDIIVTYFIRNKHYDIVGEINPVLFSYDQPTLGA